jgi:hypothetical protein
MSQCGRVLSLHPCFTTPTQHCSTPSRAVEQSCGAGLCGAGSALWSSAVEQCCVEQGGGAGMWSRVSAVEQYGRCSSCSGVGLCGRVVEWGCVTELWTRAVESDRAVEQGTGLWSSCRVVDCRASNPVWSGVVEQLAEMIPAGVPTQIQHSIPNSNPKHQYILT